jgi:hypothetical protein
MALFNKDNQVKKETVVVDVNQLTIPEIEIILNALRNSTLKGEHVELFYNAVLKLQNQYSILKK